MGAIYQGANLLSDTVNGGFGDIEITHNNFNLDGNIIPDYANMESTHVISTNGGSWTNTKGDGFLLVGGTTSTAVGRITVTVNTRGIAQLHISSANQTATTVIPVKRGDTVVVSATVGTWASTICMFIPPVVRPDYSFSATLTNIRTIIIQNTGNASKTFAFPNTNTRYRIRRRQQTGGLFGGWSSYISEAGLGGNATVSNNVLTITNFDTWANAGYVEVECAIDMQDGTEFIIGFTKVGVATALGAMTQTILRTIRLIDNPQTWAAAGNEMRLSDSRGNLFGRRFTGNITSLLNQGVTTQLTTAINGNTVSPVTSGGWVATTVDGAGKTFLGHASPTAGQATTLIASRLVLSATALNMLTILQLAGTTSFDVWAIYTKP